MRVEKLVSVLSKRIAMPRNALIFAKTFRLVPPGRHVPVVLPNHGPVAAGRDHSPDATRFEIGKETVGIEGLVGNEGCAIEVLQDLFCPLGGVAQEVLELGKDLFDRVEIRAGGWEGTTDGHPPA